MEVMVPWRTVFFAVNFAAALLFILSCALSVGQNAYAGGSAFAFLGGVCFVWPAMAFAVGEWLLYVRKVQALERPLGVTCGLIGALAVFGFFSNLAEASSKGTSPGLP